MRAPIYYLHLIFLRFRTAAIFQPNVQVKPDGDANGDDSGNDDQTHCRREYNGLPPGRDQFVQ